MQDSLTQIAKKNAENLEATSISTAIKEVATKSEAIAVTPTVNKFGVNFSKGIQVTSTNLK